MLLLHIYPLASVYSEKPPCSACELLYQSFHEVSVCKIKPPVSLYVRHSVFPENVTVEVFRNHDDIVMVQLCVELVKGVVGNRGLMV